MSIEQPRTVDLMTGLIDLSVAEVSRVVQDSPTPAGASITVNPYPSRPASLLKSVSDGPCYIHINGADPKAVKESCRVLHERLKGLTIQRIHWHGPNSNSLCDGW